ncbi:hypothetical protein ACN267_25475 [Micromonospora sp. WMMD734]|uniref:hypothetical protein n=1 Tax=Micromonospora sp. WMMD734 TaxID=3404129 RepID=UPI003B93C8FA
MQLDYAVTYDEGSSGELRATIIQAVGNRIAYGSVRQYRTWTCTGQTQPLSALIPANVAGVPLRTGEALLYAWISACPGAN